MIYVKYFGIFLGILIVVWIGLLVFQGFKSKSMKPNVGIENGQLKACGPKPNCICSHEDEESQFYYTPLQSNEIESVWEKLKEVLKSKGFPIVKEEGGYIHATASTKLMGFVDDLEFLLNSEKGTIHLRSASRVGYSDMGKNRKRMDDIVSSLGLN